MLPIDDPAAPDIVMGWVTGVGRRADLGRAGDALAGGLAISALVGTGITISGLASDTTTAAAAGLAGLLGAAGAYLGAQVPSGLLASARRIDRAIGAASTVPANHDRVLSAASFVTTAGGRPLPPLQAAFVERAARDLETLDPRAFGIRIGGRNLVLAVVALAGLALAVYARRGAEIRARDTAASADGSFALALQDLGETLAAIEAAAGAEAAPAPVKDIAAALRATAESLRAGTIDKQQAVRELRALAERSERTARAFTARDAAASALARGQADALGRAATELRDAAKAQERDPVSAPAGPGEAKHREAAGADDGSHDDATEPRRLERLSRDMEETSEICRTNPEACRANLERLSRDLSGTAPSGGDANGANALERLAQAARDLGKRLGGGNPGAGKPNSSSERSAEGERGPGRAPQDGERAGSASPPAPGAPGPNERSGNSGAQNSPGSSGSHAPGTPGTPGKHGTQGSLDPAAGARAADSGESGRAAAMPKSEGSAGAATGAAEFEDAAAAGGTGIGRAPGNPSATGARGVEGRAGAGVEREVEVVEGAGPSRSDVVETSASRGFAGLPYRNVYLDYRATLEETLDQTGVPPARRQLVREYFHLIRPRGPGAKP